MGKLVNQTGRPRKYTAAELSDKVRDFIAFCEETHTTPSDYALMTFLKVSARTLDRYYSAASGADDMEDGDEDDKFGFGEAIKKIVRFREDWAMRLARENPKMTGHIAFLLKQPHFGGWTDRQDTANRDVSIRILLGPGDECLAD
jgi:hypothetical protein